MTRIGHSAPPSTTALNDRSDDGVAKAASGLEAHFLRQILAEVRDASPALDGGFAGSTFKEMLDGALADSMAAAGGIGLGKMIEKELSRTPDAKPAAIDRAQTLAPLAGLPVRPVTGVVTSRYGARVDPIEGDQRIHAGVDLRASAGTPARAAQAGVVVRAEPAGGYGNLVVVDHGGGLETRYGHLGRIDVQVGQRVAAGEPVGEVGATGRATGPHLHFEVRRDGRTVDPVTPKVPPRPVDAD
jgi:murein DD-endopeptidase MepM/ murein hydrolase activator NlpD